MTSGAGVSLRPATAADSAAVVSLLADAGLPRDGVTQWLEHFWVAERDGQLAGVAGLELYSDGALLRSVAVAPALRGAGVGRMLTQRMMETARAAGVPAIDLLTTSAQDYFPRMGFARVTREEVPASVQQSVEFQDACPASAVIMRRVISDHH